LKSGFTGLIGSGLRSLPRSGRGCAGAAVRLSRAVAFPVVVTLGRYCGALGANLRAWFSCVPDRGRSGAVLLEAFPLAPSAFDRVLVQFVTLGDFYPVRSWNGFQVSRCLFAVARCSPKRHDNATFDVMPRLLSFPSSK